MSDFSNYSEEFLAKHLFGIAALTMPNTFYMRLHTSDAGEDGTTNQVSGGSYAPQTVAWQWDATNKWVEISALKSFTGMPAATIGGFSIHSASSGGNCYGKGSITSSTLAGQTLEIAAEGATFALSGDFSNYSREFLAKHLFGVAALTMPSAWFVELHTGAPGNDGTANVVSGGSYARQSHSAWTWSSGNNRVENGSVINFTGMPTATITHVSIHSASSGGNCYATAALSSSIGTQSGDTARFAANALTFEVR